jgi:two-component system, OmpR family, KDP operon response regulator KdpE
MSESNARILIVEDEADIRRFVRLTLESEGHEVFEADCSKRGLIEAGTRRPDLAVLDLGLPDGDGLDLIKDLRQWSNMPVIVLSARSTEAEKIKALDAGADDYLVKPFGSGELMARVRAQLRRQAHVSASTEPKVEFGDVEIDLLKRTVKKNAHALHLTPIEYKLLTYLISQRDCVITHSQLMKTVWGPSHLEDKHYVRVHMANLRKKIEDNPSHPKYLMTEAGVGYRFKFS